MRFFIVTKNDNKNVEFASFTSANYNKMRSYCSRQKKAGNTTIVTDRTAVAA